MKRAFTVIELLVCLAIIAVLFSLLLPALKHARHAADLVACASNLHQIHLAATLRYQTGFHRPCQFEGLLPFLEKGSYEVFQDPGYPGEPVWGACYYLLDLSQYDVPGVKPMGRCGQPWHKGRVNVLFNDGHVEVE